VGEGDGRQPSCVQDFVRIGVADSAEEAGIGEGALERAVFCGECIAEGTQIAGEDFDSTGIDGLQAVLAGEDMQRGAMFGAGFGEYESAVRELESSEISAG
jgi:hypothetical protein